jgi:hypothetical protein
MVSLGFIIVSLGIAGNARADVITSGIYTGFLEGLPPSEGIAMTMGYSGVPDATIGATGPRLNFGESEIGVEFFRDSTTEDSGVFENFTALLTNSLNENMIFTTGFYPLTWGYTETSLESARFWPHPNDLAGAVVEKIGFTLHAMPLYTDVTTWQVDINVYGSTAPVPEPASILLLGSGLLGLIGLRRKFYT